MTAILITVENTTESNITHAPSGLTFVAGVAQSVSRADAFLLNDASLFALLTSGDLIVSFGGTALDSVQARFLIAVGIAQYTGFDNSTNGFSADNVQEAIEETLTKNINFSYRFISGILRIPYAQQMVVYQEFCLGANTELILDGEAVALL